jgi:hypothetical protein
MCVYGAADWVRHRLALARAHTNSHLRTLTLLHKGGDVETGCAGERAPDVFEMSNLSPTAKVRLPSGLDTDGIAAVGAVPAGGGKSDNGGV